MKVRISTDSTADIPVSIQQELEIAVLPLMIETEKGEFLDGVTLTTETFYEELEKAERLPSSAAVTPLAYEDLFEQTYRDGYTDLIHISINAAGSSTYQNACLAKDMFFQDYPEASGVFHIHCIDSGTYSMGYGMATIEAARMAKRGCGAEEILSFVKDWIAHNVVLFVPLELSFVRRSGRISGAAALIGDALGIKPVITFENGSARTLEKARGEKMAMRSLLRLAKKMRKAGTPVAIAFGMDSETNAAWEQAVRQEITDAPEMIPFQLGCVITINSGPKAFGLIFRKDEA